MNAKIDYDFAAELWQHEGNSGWFFLSLPEELSREIRAHLGWQEEGWGRMKATASVQGHTWETAIWFDKKSNTYLLPIKAEIRKKTGIKKKEIIKARVTL